MPSNAGETVGALAALYLGNILYALERCALALEADAKPADAAFYRGIGRKLAEAHGAARGAAGGPPAAPSASASPPPAASAGGGEERGSA